MWPDVVNGLFELLAAPFILLSIAKLSQDKKVRGISWMHPAFFTAWGFWNLYYYPHLEQWASFVGGIAIVVVNAIWVSQLVYYTFLWRGRNT